MKRAFHEHDKQLGNVLKMGWARAAFYACEPSALLSDVKKYVSHRRAT